MTPKYLMALDQGTTSSRCILFDRGGKIVSVAQKEFPQIFPAEGWVEHNPADILQTQLSVAREAVAGVGGNWAEIAGIGITNQRETTLLWDRKTGEPVYNAIVWQCRRTAAFCESLKKQGYEETIRQKTGLLADPYFSATKLAWILDNVSGARERAERGELCFGTVDSFLIWHLTGGRIHATDYTNASRTMLFNIHTLSWDEELLKFFRIPASVLPEAKPSSSVFGYTDESVLGAKVPIGGVAGDQQAALFGQCCFDAGELKNTYGTGGFLLMNTGDTPRESKNGLLTTIACGVDGKVNYALEGSVFTCGAAIQWLRDGLKILTCASASEERALCVKDSGGVWVVPAFAGLGAPYWDPCARGIIVGITRGTTQEHIIRATLDSMAYQTADVIALMERETGLKVPVLRVDGGASANNLLMQIQANTLGIPVERPACIETTALGAAYLCGLTVGFFASAEEIRAYRATERTFAPTSTAEERETAMKKWHTAVERALAWEEI